MWGGSLLNAIGGKHFEKSQFWIFLEYQILFKNTPMKDTHEEDPYLPKPLGNRRKLAFIFSNSFCRLISNYLGLLYLPFWGFY